MSVMNPVRFLPAVTYGTSKIAGGSQQHSRITSQSIGIHGGGGGVGCSIWEDKILQIFQEVINKNLENIDYYRTLQNS
jgi:hypothetical protein